MEAGEDLMRLGLKIRRLNFAIGAFALVLASSAQAAGVLTCPSTLPAAAPGTLTGTINSYWRGNASAAAGATAISMNAPRGAHTIAPGDLLLVIQMQGASINTSNTVAYGDGATGSGYLSAGLSAGNYEYVQATSALAGGAVSIAGVGTGAGLIHPYTNAGATATTGATRFQVVYVPRYVSAVLTGDLVPAVWNGRSGGVIALEVQLAFNLAGHNVNANGNGFRGGLGIQQKGAGGFTTTDYVQPSDAFSRAPPDPYADGSKGEGIAGTPANVIDATGLITAVPTDAYPGPGGGYSRGAPGNAGGGGNDANPAANDQNTGGGGGGNGGAGGKGGFNWSPTFPAGVSDLGGLGGGAYSNASEARIVFGGGGGAGTNNDGTGAAPLFAGQASSGAPGGGIIILRAGNFTGTGTVSANGSNADSSVAQDGTGGGGAGGTVVLMAGSGSIGGTLTVTATGGKGGNNAPGNGVKPHGPGGGGGGGSVYLTSTVAASTAAGGAAGSTNVVAPYNANFGAVAGSAGVLTLDGNLIHGVAGYRSASECGVSTTAVHMGHLDAIASPSGVTVRWHTQEEQENLGFLVFREQKGRRVQLTEDLIAGSALQSQALLRAGYSYAWNDPEGTLSSRYYVEDVDLSGRHTVHGPLRPKFGQLPPSVQPKYLSQVLNSVATQPLTPVRRPRVSAPAQHEGLRVPSEAALRTQRWLAQAGALKISINHDGWYRVTSAQLSAAGWDISPRHGRRLGLYAEGQRIPLRETLVDGATAVEFYGTGLDAQSTDTRVYWLVGESRPGPIMDQVAATPLPAPSLDSALTTTELLERTLYFPGLQNQGGQKFFGAIVGSRIVSQNVSAVHLSSTSPVPAVLTVSLQGATFVPHRVHVALNGVELRQVTFANEELHEESLTVPAGLLHEGANAVTLTRDGDLADVSLVEELTLTYPRTLEADGDMVTLKVPGGLHELQVTGFSRPDAKLLDITDKDAVKELASSVASVGKGFVLKARVNLGGPRMLLAFASPAIQTPAALVLDIPSDLRQLAGRAKYLAVGPPDFLAAAEPLFARRSQQGLPVARVDIEDVFDEYSFGNRTPEALADFVTDVARTAPLQFLLLLGDATADPRDYLGLGDADFVPTHLVDTTTYQAAADDYFVRKVEGASVGRLPARSAADVTRFVGKIAAYEDSTEPRAPPLLVADTPDEVANFEASTDALLPLLPHGLSAQVIRRGPLGDPASHNAILASVNAGPGLVNYAGHGSVDLWHGDMLVNDDAASFTNVSSPSVFLMMTCMNGAFHTPEMDSLSEALLRAPGGAVAVVASSAIVPVQGQSTVNEGLVRLLFGDGSLTLGQALSEVKKSVHPDEAQTWNLLGDPALRARVK